MMNSDDNDDIKFDKRLALMKQIVVNTERKNLSSREKNDEQMIQEIIKIILEVDKQNI
jgi:hypothetical protein